MQKETIAVIIPVFNEKNCICQSLENFQSLRFAEIIVVDGGSTDGTYEIIKKEFPSIQCFQTTVTERAVQMNFGASKSISDILVFVHADTKLPINAGDLIRKKLDKDYIAGGFYKQYDQSNFLLQLYLKCLNYLYLGKMKCLVGTNAIFVKRTIFEQVKGFPEVPFLEDVIFSDIVNTAGSVAVVREPVIVSSRKYLKTGSFKQILRNFRILIGYKIFKKNPVRLLELYRRS